MSKVVVKEADLDYALEMGRRRMETEFRAKSVGYDETRDVIALTLFGEIGDFGLVFRRQDIAELRDVSVDDLQTLEISPAGIGLDLDACDIYISVHGLVMCH